MATDFSSLDKLVEFGLGIGIATQMMNTMNHVMAQTAIPGVGINPGQTSNAQAMRQVAAPTSPAHSECKPLSTTPAPRTYYIVRDERLAGPLSEDELTQLVKRGVVTNDTFCWYPGLESWSLAEDIPEVNKLLLLNS